MHTISRTRWIPYSPHFVYAVLTDPEKFEQIVKRIEAIRILERHGERGTILAKIDLPGRKWIETTGTVEGEVGKRLVFTTHEPFPLKITWDLKPEIQGTLIGSRVTNSVELDLSPIAALWSKLVLTGYLSTEIDDDLQRLEDTVANESALV
ncbi:MAG: SRPBCC family protein [Chloroflexi bacterium]|nr:SRPBCC family protein [Chloroflexota bacterium]